ncbi:Dpy-30 motif [Cinara cedri]|uniref:Dpy-30 motif n=1 Tax=Cinara cedri TaxID=506608 RepID=A0A5E4MZ60_9HEMI|nr:Dpy-30 motif [Cinara cedri]
MDGEFNVEHKIHVLERLKEKMTLLEEFERITDFGGIERLSCEEYLMKYVTSTLTKLIVQVAKVRPRNPVDFLAYMALKENREGLPDFPGYSKEGVRIKNILERIFRMYGYDDDIINSNPLMKYLEVHSVNREDKEISAEPFFE